MPKIIINGPESSGKTSLAEWLVAQLKAGYIQEYPRLYLEYLEGDYEYDDLQIIAEDIQDILVELDDQKLWVIDTDIINIKVWYQIVYDRAEAEVMNMEDDHNALHLLCKPDIPWESDPVREAPEHRDAIFQKYLEYYQSKNIKYMIVDGDGEERFEKALEAARLWHGQH